MGEKRLRIRQHSSQRHERRLTNQWIPTDWRPTDSAIGGDRNGIWLAEHFTPIRSPRPLSLRRESHIHKFADLSATTRWPVVSSAISKSSYVFKKITRNLFFYCFFFLFCAINGGKFRFSPFRYVCKKWITWRCRMFWIFMTDNFSEA